MPQGPFALQGESTAVICAVKWHKMLMFHRSPAAIEGHGWTEATIREVTAMVLTKKKDLGLTRVHSEDLRGTTKKRLKGFADTMILKGGWGDISIYLVPLSAVKLLTVCETKM